MTNNSTTQAGKAIAEDQWLHYYNRVLLETGTITKHEYVEMQRKILARTAAHSSAKPKK